MLPSSHSTLDQWLAYLESIHPAEIDLGLDRVLMVYRRLFRNRPKARIITIAGTNGKGSTVASLEQLLMRAGRTVGTYTSPHLERYNERVRINGLEVPDTALVAAFTAIDQARRNTTLTYFEFGTLAALMLMAEAGVEDWILEVGLGGRLDAVNIVDADLAIITSIDIDHVSYLGNDREVIGFEKAGILRTKKPAIYADINPPGSVLQQAVAQSIPLRRLGVDYNIEHGSAGQVVITCPSLERTITLSKCELPENSVAAAIIAAVMLEPALADNLIVDAITAIQLPGRFEKLSSNPSIYVDVGHNPHAAAWLAAKLVRARSSDGLVVAVYAGLEDKDTAGVVRALKLSVDQWYLAGLSCARGLSADELKTRVESELADTDLPIRSCETVSEALRTAVSGAGPNDLVIAFGSFFTVAEARRTLLTPTES